MAAAHGGGRGGSAWRRSWRQRMAPVPEKSPNLSRTRLLFSVLFRGISAKAWTFFVISSLGANLYPYSLTNNVLVETSLSTYGLTNSPLNLRPACMRSDISDGKVNSNSYRLPNTPLVSHVLMY
jgi:hypothetical protein